MPSPRIPDAVKRLFTDAFAARDIAEPLVSFDEEKNAADIRAFMEANGFDVVGMRVEGRIVGFVESNSLTDGPAGRFCRPLDDAPVLADDAPLVHVLMKLKNASFAFVSVFRSVGGIITRADLQKPAVRMWLFGFVTLIELRFTELIELHCPDWQTHVSEGRLEKAKALQEERKRRQQEVELVHCLQFADKGQIIARNERIRGMTVFSSKRQAEEATRRLERLRNNLAHAQDIVTSDWDTIIELCDFITQS